jgi:hypothetical protein
MILLPLSWYHVKAFGEPFDVGPSMCLKKTDDHIYTVILKPVTFL